MGGEGHVVKEAHEYSPVCMAAVQPQMPPAKLVEAEPLQPCWCGCSWESVRGLLQAEWSPHLTLQETLPDQPVKHELRLLLFSFFQLFKLLLLSELGSANKAGVCSAGAVRS